MLAMRHYRAARDILGLCLCLFAIGMSPVSQAQAAPETGAPLPDFSGIWIHGWGREQQQLLEPPQSGPGPVKWAPGFERTKPSLPWVADIDSPILQPKARLRLKETADQERNGKPFLKNDGLCLPVGVAAALTLFDPIQVLQTPTQVMFIYARDQQTRFVNLNKAHSKNLKPSWYGESIGHYEGDTLVVDTIGMNDKTIMDRFGTPHSEELHVIERYRLSDDRTKLEVKVTFEDPIAFTTAWSAGMTYERSPQRSLEEIVCAENNRPTGDEWHVPIPTAQKADF